MLYQKKNPHGGSADKRIVLDFSANVNPLGPPESVVFAAAEALLRMDRYPDPCCSELTKAIAGAEGLPESFVLCGNGASELIYAFCRAEEPDTALIPVPAFSEYEQALRACGAKVSFFETLEEDGFTAGPGIIDAIKKERPDVLFLCSPSNPAGTLLEESLANDILHACEDLGTRVLLDECFIDLSDGASLARLVNDHPCLVVLKAFTKSWGMAGLRLGYCLSSDPDLLAGMSDAIQPWNVSGPAQAAGTSALKEQGYLEKTMKLIREERSRLFKTLEGLGLRPVPSSANFILFRGPSDLSERLIPFGIAVRDCSNYRGLGPGWYRTAVRLTEENSRLINALTDIIKGSTNG